MDAVHAIFERARRLDRWLVRTTAHLEGEAYADHPGRVREPDGTLREDGFVALDRVLAAAAEHEVRLILVLSNHWRDYGGALAVLRAIAPSENLPVDAFYSDERAIAAQREYVDALVSRTNTMNGRAYASDPTIFAWELINEARCEDARFCDSETLARWATRMSRAIRDGGAMQLVAWGGVGFAQEHGENFNAIAMHGEVDIMTLHLYPDAAGALTIDPLRGAAPGVLAAITSGAAAIRDRAARARALGVALLVEEAGWRATDAPWIDSDRALILGTWAGVAWDERVGFLPWMIAEPDRPDYDGYLIDPERHLATVRALACE